MNTAADADAQASPVDEQSILRRSYVMHNVQCADDTHTNDVTLHPNELPLLVRVIAHAA